MLVKYIYTIINGRDSYVLVLVLCVSMLPAI